MKKSIITLIVVVLVLALFLTAALCGLNLGLFKIDKTADGVVLGLDLVGGSEITYEAQIPEGAENVSEGMSSAVSMLRQRLNKLGYTEAEVTKSGSNRIVVDIPAVEDPEEAVQLLGSTAEISFQDADGKVWLTGSDIESAKYEYGPTDTTGVSTHHVVLAFTSEGRTKFAEATRTVANRTGGDNYLDIVMDGASISQPFVGSEYATEGINSDSAVITLGTTATAENAKYLAELISAGQMPFTLECVQLSAVGASLGEKSLETSLLAGLIGLVLVMLFMIVMYRVCGAISCISLVLYGAVFAVIISVAHINLSLPGIAGIILTIGMAVDANVVIYERVREELRAGKTLRASVDAGYKHAVTAIIDANITTLIAAVVLWRLGTGTIISFAQTLFIGTILSMIIMLLLTRILMKTAIGLKITNPKAYGV